MSNSKKVLYVELENRYPYAYTNSQSVCNVLNSKSCRNVEEDGHKPNILTVLDLDRVKSFDENIYEVFSSTIEELLCLIGCEIIWLASADYDDKEFLSRIPVEHQTEVG